MVLIDHPELPDRSNSLSAFPPSTAAASEIDCVHSLLMFKPDTEQVLRLLSIHPVRDVSQGYLHPSDVA